MQCTKCDGLGWLRGVGEKCDECHGTGDLCRRDGWTAEPTSLYDEEGVEGWRFDGPDGEEIGIIGDWTDPPPWDELETNT